MNWLRQKSAYAFMLLVLIPTIAAFLPSAPVYAADAIWLDAAHIKVGSDVYIDSILADSGRQYYLNGIKGCSNFIGRFEGDPNPSSNATLFLRHPKPENTSECVEDGSRPIEIGEVARASVYFYRTAEDTLTPAFQNYDFELKDLKTGQHDEIGAEIFQNSSAEPNVYGQKNSGDCHSTVQTAPGSDTGRFTPRKDQKHIHVWGTSYFECESNDTRTVLISNTPPDPSVLLTPPGGSVKDKCNISGGLGWILCPLISVGTGAVNFLETRVLSSLHTAPISATENGGPSQIYRAWSVFRNMTNVFFVLIFFAIIFGNALGIDAYTVKKVLPRLILAVIFVQFSFVILSLAIDITNVLGLGIGGLLSPLAGLPGAGSGNSDTVHFFGGLEAAALVAVGGTVAFTLGLIIPLLLMIAGAFLSILAVFVTLELRVIVLHILILISPLAFAAWVLPNTEKFFKTWSKTLMSLLMMFPLIVVIIYSGKLVSALPGLTGSQDSFQQVMSALAPILIFSLVPLTLKASSAVLGKVTGGVLGRTKGVGGGMRNQLRKNAMESSRRKSGLLLDSENGRMKKALGAIGTGTAFSFGKSGNYKKAQAYSSALESEGKLVKEDLKRRGIAGNNGKVNDYINEKDVNGKSVRTRAEQIAAMQMLGDNGGIEELNAIYQELVKQNHGITNPDDDNAPWKPADKELWARGTENSRSVLAKALPYAVRPDGDASIMKLDAESFVNMKGAAGDPYTYTDSSGATVTTSHIERAVLESKTTLDAARTTMNRNRGSAPGSAGDIAYKAAEEKERKEIDKQKRLFSTMLNIGQSTDRRGRVDHKNVLAFARVAAQLDSSVQLDIKPTVGAVKAMTAQEFTTEYVDSTSGQIKPVPG